ncbi:aspartyl protease family protein [Phenylobacterium terrae]|uniref:Aspartyl protease family protein n=1 Tax=Phenylobacterium terrae TaxID=2665495 RepID=A0ABW4N353_9CAUL
MRQVLLGLAAALSLAEAASAAEGGCQLQKVADLPVTMAGLKPHVPAKINGRDVVLVADSGAFFSMLGEANAKRLGLSRGMTPPGMRVRGVGGTAPVKVGVADRFELSGGVLTNVDFLVGDLAPGSRADGILGQNVLGVLDVEYDFANGAIRLFKPQGCEKARLAYWAGDKPVNVLSFRATTPSEPHVIANASVNGRPIRVMFDTGAFRSVLEQSTAERLGFRPDGPGVEYGGLSGGIGPRRLENWIAPFAEFAIGEEKIQNTRLRVAPITLPKADMLLGADFFLSHRILISNSQDRVYFTYNGGPVFRLEPVEGGPEEPAQVAGAADEPKDADGYHRRAAASLARADHVRAIADFTRAIELEPRRAIHLRQRAAAHLASGDPAAARRDLDAALALAGGDVEARLMRGELRLSAGDADGAAEDFARATASPASGPGVRARIAQAWLAAGKAGEAVAQYDVLLAGAPPPPVRAAVLASRCQARALVRTDLALALADCEAALKIAARDPSALAARGLVHLQSARLEAAQADFDAALKRDPRHAQALYGRSLVLRRQGRAAEADADARAAQAVWPQIAAIAARYELGSPAGGP